MSDFRVFDIEQLVDDTERLVSFPSIVTSLLQTLDDQFADIHDIAALIRQDPALTSELIKVCNSSVYYVSGDPVCSVEQAVKLVGTEQVTSLCLALCACDATNSLSNEVIELKHYWYHCLLTACLSSVLAERIPGTSRGAAFTGGLLHDIGQLPLFYHYPVESMTVLEKCQLYPDQRVVDAERSIFGFTHEEVGMRLAEKWNFPPQLGLCLSKHHSGNLNADTDGMAMVVHVANILSECLETEDDPEMYFDVINPTAMAFALPEPEALPQIFERALGYFDDVHSSILVK